VAHGAPGRMPLCDGVSDNADDCDDDCDDSGATEAICREPKALVVSLA